MRRIGTWLLAWLLVGACGCDRTDEPRSRTVNEARAPSAKQTATQPQKAPSSPSSSSKPAGSLQQAEREPTCIVPTPEQPPPEAKPATRCPRDPLESPPPLPTGQLVFTDAPGQPTLRIEVARSQAVRARGLMYRQSLDDDAGMLFSWEDDRPRSFWMHNTCIPLDMLFIDKDGYIAGILEQVPTMNDLSRRNPCPVRHVLEVNAGYSRHHGIRAGQKVEIQEE